MDSSSCLHPNGRDCGSPKSGLVSSHFSSLETNFTKERAFSCSEKCFQRNCCLSINTHFPDGGTQIFYSYGVGIGALLALGSYNKFHHNCHRDALFVCTVNTFTSFFSATVIFPILGYMAHSKGVEVGDVVKSGPGLAFLVYPEVVLTLAPSPLWAGLFFVMLLTLGIDSQFAGTEALMTGLVDNWPETLRPHRKKFTLGMTVFMCLLGLPMITRVSAS